MSQHSRKHHFRGRRTHERKVSGFTIVEIAMAVAVLALGISSSIVVIGQGMRTMDNARVTTLAGQVLQSQIEKLRLLSWAQLTSSDGPSAYATFIPDLADATPAQLNRFVVGADKGRCSQSIVDAPAPFSSTMKVITLTAAWDGLDGRPHSVTYATRYAKNGLSDFFYTAH